MRRSDVDTRLAVLLLSPLLVHTPASTGADSAEARFEPVQPALFSTPEALTSAWSDYDNDGDLDLAVTFKSGEIRLYRNDGGIFVSAGAQLGLPVKGPSEGRGLAWGDYDGDGYADLYVGTRRTPTPDRNLLFHNEGGDHFSEVAEAMGVAMPGASSRQVSWVDYDNDGDLDLFVADRIGANALFRNDGARFSDVAKRVGLADVRRTVGACWFDMDEDGDLDVFLANQEGDKDAFYRNDSGQFNDIAPELGMHQPQRRLAEGGVGCAVGDFDNDGALDLFVATYGENLLYRNQRGGRFIEVAKSFGIAGEGHSVAASWGDFDNDGRLDLYVAAYVREAQGLRPDDRLWRNDVEHFVRVPIESQPANQSDHGVQWADFDRDGDLDLSLTDSRANGGHVLLRNELPKAAASRSLQVAVLDRRGRYTRAGAEVRLYDTSGSLLGTRLVSANDGYDAQNVQPVHFGLAGAGKMRVEVTFLTPSGRKVQRILDVRPGRLRGKPLVVREE